VKTEQLLDALVADRGPGPRPVARAVVYAVAASLVISLAFFFIEMGIRADIRSALATWRFDLKIAMALLAVGLAVGLCRDCLQPDMPSHPLRRLAPLLAVILTAVAIELAIVPLSQWDDRLVGTNALVCLTMIPPLSLAPLAAALIMLRRGAPASPALAGAAAGVLAAACGATLYAFHCFDDSPLFVAVWYSLGALPVVALGALAGHRLLRW
jgi:hypothetical protein